MDLPDNYHQIGAYIHFQRFLLRYGTHYIKSAKFGAQLQIVKTMKSTQKMTEEEFSKQVKDKSSKDRTWSAVPDALLGVIAEEVK